MKKVWIFTFALVLAVSVVSCGTEEEPTPTNGTITGTVTLQPGVTGDLDGSRVAIYVSVVDWQNDNTLKTTQASGGTSSATYTISDVIPSQYYLDVWKDVNNNMQFDSGDLWGVYGATQYPPTPSPFTVSSGQTVTIDVEVFEIP
jgi:uncharacterized protein (DUF2141 family)